MRAQLSATLVLLCLLQAKAEMPVQADFQFDQFTGTWFTIGLASDTDWFKEEKQGMKMCKTRVMLMKEGYLGIDSTCPEQDKCVTRWLDYLLTDEPGRFNRTTAWSPTKHNLRVLETNYDEYALLGNTITEGADTFTIVTLYGRQKELRPELLAKFTQTALSYGLAQEDILILPRTELCMG